MAQAGAAPGRFTAWTLASRTRYAFVWSTIVIASLLVVSAMDRGISRTELLIAIPAYVVNFLLQARFAYPRARQRRSPTAP